MVLAKVIAAYLVGSISGSLVLGKLRHVDIRQSGSGNAGGTNALRSQGVAFALAVVVIDIGKGALAAGLIAPAWGHGPVSMLTLQGACGLAAIVGHMYPVYFGFRGGKGVATFAGVMLVLAPLAVAGAIAILLLTVVVTGYVGLGSILAAVSSVALVWLIKPATELVVFCALAAAVIVYAHRVNITRLRDGTEHRFERVRVVNWFK